MSRSARDQRALRVLFFGVVPLFAALYALPLYLRQRSARLEQLYVHTELLEREQALLGDTSRMSRNLDVARRDLRVLSRTILSASSSAEAGSAVGEQLRAHARRAGLDILRAGEPQVGDSQHGLAEIRIELDARGAFSEISRFFSALRADPLQIRIERWVTERSVPLEPMTSPVRVEDRKLRLGLTVVALVQIGELSAMGGSQ